MVVCNGDGSMLMNLGSLATEITSGTSNLVHVIWDNGAWEITGGQPAGSPFGVDLEVVARGCGFGRTATVEDRTTLAPRRHVSGTLAGTDPGHRAGVDPADRAAIGQHAGRLQRTRRHAVVDRLQNEGIWTPLEIRGPAPYLPDGYGGTPAVGCYYLTALVG